MIRFLPLALLLVSAPVAAQSPAPAGPALPTQAKPNPLDKMVCRTEDSLGTRLGAKRVCLTVREWQEQQQANREVLQKLQQQSEMVVPST